MPGTPGVAGAATAAPMPGTPFWAVAVVRSAPALIAGLLIAFTGAHSPAFGLVVFGVWALVDAVLGGVLVAVSRTAGRADGPGASSASAAQPVVTGASALVRIVVVAAGGVVGLALVATGAAEALVLVVGLTALAAGAADAVTAARTRRGIPLSRDLVIAAGITLLLGVATLAIPSGLDQPFHGAPGHPGVLTASIVVTGLFGAWGVITGVLWGISAVGFRDVGARPVAVASGSESASAAAPTGEGPAR